jgi:hypothetical protein
LIQINASPLGHFRCDATWPYTSNLTHQMTEMGA